MNKRNPQQEFEELRAGQLSAIDWPHEISIEVKNLLEKAMLYTSIMGTRCPQQTYRNLIKWERPFKLGEITIIIDILIGATPIELNQSLVENLEMLENIIYPLREKWRDIDDVLSKKIMDKLNVQLQITRGVPESKKLFIPVSHR